MYHLQLKTILKSNFYNFILINYLFQVNNLHKLKQIDLLLLKLQYLPSTSHTIFILFLTRTNLQGRVNILIQVHQCINLLDNLYNYYHLYFLNQLGIECNFVQINSINHLGNFYNLTKLWHLQNLKTCLQGKASMKSIQYYFRNS